MSSYGFGVDSKTLAGINAPQLGDENLSNLKKSGGNDALLDALKVEAKVGLTGSSNDVSKRQKAFGRNHMPEPEAKSWLQLFIDTFEDATVIILMVSAIVSLVVGIYDDPQKGWIEGVAILAAVLVVAVVTATNDYSKEQQFRSLNKKAESIPVKVIRMGKVMQIMIEDIVVGDIVSLEAGDKIPADGVLIQGSDVFANESDLTGEPEDVHKDPVNAPFMLSGCKVSAGAGVMVVIAVGIESQWGRVKAMLSKEETNTPLQDKLDTLAEQIGYVGMGFAALTFIAMLTMWYIDPEAQADSERTLFKECLNAFIIGVTIVVVAVPEGLPLAVTISLAYSTKKMLKDNNLIRVLAACETMGNATNICSDKTGTLTLNRMTVVESYMAGQYSDSDMGTTPCRVLSNQISPAARNMIIQGICVNTTANLDDTGSVLGNKTEGALLLMVASPNTLPSVDYYATRNDLFQNDGYDRVFPFSSARKRMSVLIANKATNGSGRVTRSSPGSNGGVLYCKGAPEFVVQDCTTKLSSDGNTTPLTGADRAELTKLMDAWAASAYRVLAIAHRDLDSHTVKAAADHNVTPESLESDMCLDALVAIQDPLRPDVVEAVAQCQAAGIIVRMVTGDNINTARAIAKQCGILRSEDGGLSMTGPDFRQLTPAQLDKVLPKLQVLARSSPEDKHTLVTRLNGVALPASREEWESAHPGRSWNKERDLILPGYREEWEAARAHVGGVGEVVGVTGDGTNDGPALRAGDVGLSMGLSGTEVAKEASDIVIMDDRFASIVKAVMWGRCVFDNIRKFLQFQLTVNVVALVLTFLSATLGYEPPLNAVMMLWVNLIMDTMGALALGTEAPTESLLDRKPLKRNASLVSRVMWRNILVQSIYQLALLLILLENGDQYFEGVVKGSVKHFTIIFNVFVFCQIFNELNARSIGDDINVFKGLVNNSMFQMVILFTIITQVGLVELGGDFLRTVPLTPSEWYQSVALGAVALPLGVLMRFIPVKEDPSDYAGYDFDTTNNELKKVA